MSTSTNKTASNGVSNDASANTHNSYSSQSASATDYSSIFISLSFATMLLVIFFVTCMFIRRQRALMRQANASSGAAQHNTGSNPDLSANGSTQDDADSVHNAPSYLAVAAELHRSVYAIDSAATRGLHHHRHYAIGDEPSSGAKHRSDLPPSYDDVTILATPTRSVSVALSEPNSCTTSSSAESTGGHADLSPSPARSTVDGFSNLAFRIDESELECTCAIPVAQGAAGITVSTTQRPVDVQQTTNANLSNELPPPTYEQVIKFTQ